MSVQSWTDWWPWKLHKPAIERSLTAQRLPGPKLSVLPQGMGQNFKARIQQMV